MASIYTSKAYKLLFRPIIAAVTFMALSAIILTISLRNTAYYNRAKQTHQIRNEAQDKKALVISSVFSKISHNEALANLISQSPNISDEGFYNFVNPILARDTAILHMS